MKILISGGGIAGLAAALFLRRQGHEVHVIDRSPSFQKRGYAITLKSFGIKIMHELGLGDALTSHAITFDGLAIYHPDDRPIQTYSHELTEKITHGQILIYRSELHAALYEAARESAAFRFGVHVEAIEQDARHARVTLSDGSIEEADLVIVSEGVRSTTRKLVWGDDCVKPFDVVYAAATVCAKHERNPQLVNGYFGESQNIAFMPTGDPNHLLIQCYWRANKNVPAEGATPRDRLVDAFRAFSPNVRTLIDAIPNDGDVFCDSIATIKLPKLHAGRVVALGDAGYCPTFLSGMGASLGLLGAKVLSSELPCDGATDLEPALTRFGAIMRPVVDHFQENAMANVENALPSNHFRGIVRGWLMHIAPPSLAAKVAGRQFDVEEKLLHGVV